VRGGDVVEAEVAEYRKHWDVRQFVTFLKAMVEED